MRLSTSSDTQIIDLLDTLAVGIGWDDHFLNVLTQIIKLEDAETVADIVATIGDNAQCGTTAAATALHLSTCATPKELADTFRWIRQYFGTIRLPHLSDVLRDATDWNLELRERLEWWLLANATRVEVEAVAFRTGHPDLISDTRYDATDLGLKLSEVISPPLFRSTWVPGHRRSRLNEEEVVALRKLRGLRKGSTKHGYHSPTRTFIERLQHHYRSGVPVGELAQAVDLTPGRIYQLLRQPTS